MDCYNSAHISAYTYLRGYRMEEHWDGVGMFRLDDACIHMLGSRELFSQGE